MNLYMLRPIALQPTSKTLAAMEILLFNGGQVSTVPAGLWIFFEKNHETEVVSQINQFHCSFCKKQLKNAWRSPYWTL